MNKAPKTTNKHNKKEEQKKLMVRILCLVMVVALVLTSGISVIAGLFQKDVSEVLADQGMTMLGYDEAGNIYALDAEGSIVLVDEHGHVLTTTETGETEAHDHDEDAAVAE